MAGAGVEPLEALASCCLVQVTGCQQSGLRGVDLKIKSQPTLPTILGFNAPGNGGGGGGGGGAIVGACFDLPNGTELAVSN